MIQAYVGEGQAIAGPARRMREGMRVKGGRGVHSPRHSVPAGEIGAEWYSNWRRHIWIALWKYDGSEEGVRVLRG